jgi:protein tyrosine phosphatase (PTP) superfamily phosphohydrolase (DUF442 family)
MNVGFRMQAMARHLPGMLLLGCLVLVPWVAVAEETQQIPIAGREENAVKIDASYNFKRINDQVTTSGVVGDQRLSALKSQGYTTVINLLPDNNDHAVQGEGAIVESQGLDYRYIPVEWSAPTRTDFAAFEQAMDAVAGQTVHVHCAANWRVSAFYGLYAERKGWWTRAQADAHIGALWNPAEYPAWQALITAIRAE